MELLCQAIKHQNFYDSALSRFLLKRSLNNQRLGHRWSFWRSPQATWRTPASSGAWDLSWRRTCQLSTKLSSLRLICLRRQSICRYLCKQYLFCLCHVLGPVKAKKVPQCLKIYQRHDHIERTNQHCLSIRKEERGGHFSFFLQMKNIFQRCSWRILSGISQWGIGKDSYLLRILALFAKM